MGGLSGEPSSINTAFDASVGALVWVRRRNGSWWPGRIVGLDELSEACLVSPRSGTPVKLLGREDASIDWYNLEKSKRVKPFRCGEYDDCIDKAKTVAASSGKKAVKYARREDAILHALEIESAQLGKDTSNYSIRMDSSSGRTGNLTTASPTMSQAGGGKETNGVSDDEVDGDYHHVPELSYPVTYSNEPSHSSSFRIRSERGMMRRTPNDSEDDGIEGTKRMRGLEDLGINVLSGKKNKLEMVPQESAHLRESNARNGLSNDSLINDGKGFSSSTLKRKRSQVAHVHDFLKKKNRRRTLTKVLESTALVSVPVTCDQLASSCGSPLGAVSMNNSSEMDHFESKLSFSSAVLDNNSENTRPSFESETMTNDAGPASNMDNEFHDHQKMKKEPPCLPEPPENVQSDSLFDGPFVSEEKKSEGFSSVVTPNSLCDHEAGVSSLAEVGSLHCEPLNESRVSISSALANVDNDVNQRIGKSTSKWQSKGKRNSRRRSNKKRRRSIGKSSNGSNSITYLGGLNYGLKEDFGNSMDGSAAAVPDCRDKKLIEVCDWGKRASPTHRGSQSSEQPGLKISPKASPISQRLLPYRQSRFTVHPRYETDEYPVLSSGNSSEYLYDVELEVNASYRSSHVPIISLMSKLNGKAIVGHPLTVEVVDGGTCNVAPLSDGLEMGFRTGRSLELIKVPAKKKKSASRFRSSSYKKSKSKKSGLMSKKMRKLSSLTRKKGGEVDLGPVAEKPRSHVITSIPLKVVFSRINEAVNGSLRPANRVSSKV